MTTYLSLLIKSFMKPMNGLVLTAAATGAGQRGPGALMLTVLSGPGMELTLPPAHLQRYHMGPLAHFSRFLSLTLSQFLKSPYFLLPECQRQPSPVHSSTMCPEVLSNDTSCSLLNNLPCSPACLPASSSFCSPCRTHPGSLQCSPLSISSF